MKLISNQQRRRLSATLAFTLIELLMVIAIIGILAALLIGSSGYVARAMKEARVRAELTQLETAIGAYKAALGSYPPDNPANPALPPLLYELLGTRVPSTSVNAPVYTNGQIGVTAAQASLRLGVPGIQNSVVSDNDSEIRSFLPQLKAKQFTNLVTLPVGVKFLLVPVEGPVSAVNPSGSLNTWRYVSTSPTNNPKSYDLWAEVVIGGKTNVISNWKK